MDPRLQYDLEFGADRGTPIRVLATLSRAPGLLVKTDVQAKGKRWTPGEGDPRLALLQILIVKALETWAQMVDSGAVRSDVDSGMPPERKNDARQGGSGPILAP